jgi:hypothetical protein
MSKKTKITLGLLPLIIILAFSLVAFNPIETGLASPTDQRGGPGNRDGNGQGNSDESGDTPGNSDQRGNSQGQRGTGMIGSGRTSTPLSETETEGLQEAILEEYGALNLYNSVMEQFGDVYPFNQIARSEQQHANTLIRQAEKYGVEIPINTDLAIPPIFASLEEACQAGVAAEIADADLYDEIIPVTTHEDLIQVYTMLQSASLEKHLPAFQTCE